MIFTPFMLVAKNSIRKIFRSTILQLVTSLFIELLLSLNSFLAVTFLRNFFEQNIFFSIKVNLLLKFFVSHIKCELDVFLMKSAEHFSIN